MDFTKRIRELLEKQNNLTWQLIGLEQQEEKLKRKLAKCNINQKDISLLLRKLKTINKNIITCEKQIAFNKQEAELIGILINKYDYAASGKVKRIKNASNIKHITRVSCGALCSFA